MRSKARRLDREWKECRKPSYLCRNWECEKIPEQQTGSGSAIYATTAA